LPARSGTLEKPVGTGLFGLGDPARSRAAPWVQTATRHFDGVVRRFALRAIITALEETVPCCGQRRDV